MLDADRLGEEVLHSGGRAGVTILDHRVSGHGDDVGLRVREELLDGDSTGALYVYKKVPSAKILLDRVSELAERKVKRR